MTLQYYMKSKLTCFAPESAHCCTKLRTSETCGRYRESPAFPGDDPNNVTPHSSNN